MHESEDFSERMKRKKKSILPLYIEIEGESDLLKLEQLMYWTGFCFVEGKITSESLERCEARLIREGIAIDPTKK